MENSGRGNKKHVGRRGVDLTGLVFGRLTVISIVGSDAYKRRVWRCKCSCGVEVTRISTSLMNGKTNSCGCLNKETARKNVVLHAMPKTKTHGFSGNHPLYAGWVAMIGRCENENNKKFKYWGGAGISVCALWRSDFMKFYEWSLLSGWEAGMQLDRIDNSLGYCPENCQWLSASDHSKKTRKEAA